MSQLYTTLYFSGHPTVSRSSNPNDLPRLVPTLSTFGQLRNLEDRCIVLCFSGHPTTSSASSANPNALPRSNYSRCQGSSANRNMIFLFEMQNSDCHFNPPLLIFVVYVIPTLLYSIHLKYVSFRGWVSIREKLLVNQVSSYNINTTNSTKSI